MRVDTGVVDGGEIPMFYDSMIAKLIVHGKDRNDAIAKMREALNGFVIRGISTNIPFQAALLAHPKFVSGDFNTGFIAENYAHGFHAEDVPHDDPNFLVALAAFVRRKSRERAAGISGQLPGYGVKVGHDFGVVTLDAAGQHGYSQVHVVEELGQIGVATVTVDGKRYAISSPSRLNDVCITGVCNGQPFTAQVERGTPRNPLALVVQNNGTKVEAMVVSPRMAELHKLMPFKAPPDMSKFVLSPMPGSAGGCGRGRRPDGAGGRARGGDRGDEDGERAVCGARWRGQVDRCRKGCLPDRGSDHCGSSSQSRLPRWPRACGFAGSDPGRICEPGTKAGADGATHPEVQFTKEFSRSTATARPFKVLGIQQIAIGGPDKLRLQKLWVEMLGLEVTGTFRSERENVDEDICAMGSGPFKVEVDLMQPLDPEKKPAVHTTPLNHIGLWIDDLPVAVEWLTAQGVRFAPGGIRKGAAGFDITFLHPKANDEFPIAGEGVLIELVQAPPEVVSAFAQLAARPA